MRYGNWNTIASRYRRWRRAGIWEGILRSLQEEAAHEGTVDDSLLLIDGSNIRAHQQAAGARKKGALIPT